MSPVPASEGTSRSFPTPSAVRTPTGTGRFRGWKNAPGNTRPSFAPDIHPTLDRGIEAIVVAASPWLLKDK